MWARDLAGQYSNRDLRPVEVMLLVRHRDSLGGRVLELGCGAGRLTGYLDELADSLRAIDVSPAMVAACRRAYPWVALEQRDLRDLAAFGDSSLDAVVAPYNVIDVLGDEGRSDLLDELGRIVASEGLLIFSSHNRAAAPPARLEISLRHRGLLGGAKTLVRLPRWLWNRHRILPLQRTEPSYAILNDSAHGYAALHYYIGRDAQQQQLAAHGYELLECLDLDGRAVGPGEDAANSTELHYVARRLPPPGA